MGFMRTVGVKLRMETGDYVRDAGVAGKATDQLKGRIGDAGTRGKQDLDKLAGAMSKVGLGLVAIAGAAVYAALKFDQQMSEVGAVANATAEQMSELRAAAIEAGRATVFSASEAAKAEAELAKAGVSTADIIGGALTGALALASAGQLELADAAVISANAMNTFGLSGADVGHIADVLSAAANKSAAGVDDLGLGLQQVGLVASQVGFSLEETVALLGAFADRGLRGSDGATSLKTALLRLAAPTDVGAKLLAQLGVSLYDANGQTISAVKLAGELHGALKDLSPVQRNAALSTIFGSDAIRAANVLYSEGAEGIQDYVDAVNDQGAAARVAAQKMDNLAGDVEQLKGSLETLFVQGGSGASSGLRTLAKGATDAVNAFSELPSGVQSAAVVVAGLTGGLLLLGAAGIKVKKTLAEIVLELEATGPAGAKAAAGLAAVARVGGTVVAVLTALTLATQATDAIDNYSVSTDGLADSLRKLGDTGQATGELTKQFGDDLGGFGDAVNSLTNPFRGLLVGVENVIPGLRQFDQNLGPGSPRVYKEQLDALDGALAKLVQDGNVDAANAAFKRLWEEAQKHNVSLDELQAAFPAYIAAAGEAAKSATKLGDSTADVNRAQVAAVQSGQKLVDVWDQFHGAAATADEAMLAAKESVDAVKQSFHDNGRAIAGNTDAALKNRIALEDSARTAAAAADAYLDAGGSVDGARSILKDFEDQAIKATGATGKQKDAVKALADSLFTLPVSKEITVGVNIIGRVIVHDSGYQDYRAGERSTTGRRWGGVSVRGTYEAAAVGTLRDAAVYSPVAPARYAFAEPQTQGEAFVPKAGNYGRSMSILSAAAGWYNADVVPRQGWYGGGGGGGNVAGSVDVKVRVEDPRGKVLHESITEYAVNTGRAPADLWSAKRR